MCPAKPELDSESTAIRALIEARLPDPFALLGPHRGDAGTTIRAFHPAARAMHLRLLATGELRPMNRIDAAGVYEVLIPGSGGADREASMPDYRLRITFPGSHVVEIDDPYRYGRVLDRQRLAPIGRVISGLEVVDALYSGYGEGAPRGSGPDQSVARAEGNAYLTKNFPKLDAIKIATIVK